jgi:medium-chain acyl-[acyl-carrier-protein] hydrolase
MQLLCFPYAGGSVQIFRSWQNQLPPGCELWLASLPGRRKRRSEPLPTRLLPLVETIADAVLADLRQPFTLFGHSMGANIAFELARTLRRAHAIEPVHLFVSGCRAPHLPRTGPSIHDLPREAFVAGLRQLNGTPDELLDDAEALELLLPAVRADFEMVETYHYEPGEPLACPITAYGGLQDPEVTQECLEAWRQHTYASFAARMVAGDHFFIHDPRFVEIVCKDIAGLFPVSRESHRPDRQIIR